MTTQTALFAPSIPPDVQASVGWDRALTARHRVLLHASPLLDLRDRDGRRDPDTRHYDTLALALRVMDLVVERMGMEREVDRDFAALALEPLLRAMDTLARVEPDRARHLRMVDRVLSALRNDEEGRRRFALPYTDFNPDGSARTAQLEFWLARDHHHADGGTVLRLSPEAINLFLRAMDLDIEDGQAAAEAVVESQIRRGRFEDAVQSARLAQLQSIRFKGKVDALVRDTWRDLTRVDWADAAPKLLEDALIHLESRMSAERAILQTADERLETLEPDSPAAKAVAEVRNLVELCRGRHLALHPALMQARNVFLEAQVQQAFRPAAIQVLPNLHAEVLPGALALPRRDALAMLTELLPGWFGARPPALLSLADLVAWQLRPRRERNPEDAGMDNGELVEGEADARFYDAEARRRAEARLRAVTERVNLGVLLERARDEGASDPEVELTASFAFELFAPDDHERALLRVQRAVGEVFDVGPLIGDDLVLEANDGE